MDNLVPATTVEIAGVELTPAQLERILQHIKYEDVKSKVELELKKNDFHLEPLLSRYMDKLSENTCKTYTPVFNKFFSGIDHPLSVNTETVDDYIISLAQEYSPATVRIHIAALSGFYSKLVRWGHTPVNPFKGADLPAMERARELKVPTEQEVGEILSYYRSSKNTRSGHKMYVAVYLMSYLGVRVGAFETLQIESVLNSQIKNGDRYKAYSKGKWITGEFPFHVKEVCINFGIDFSQEYPFREITKNSIQFYLWKDMHRLLELGKINQVHHAHGFRHFFAVETYKRTKDIYAVSRVLNHSSVNITQRYLSSIGVIKGDM